MYIYGINKTKWKSAMLKVNSRIWNSVFELVFFCYLFSDYNISGDNKKAINLCMNINMAGGRQKKKYYNFYIKEKSIHFHLHLLNLLYINVFSCNMNWNCKILSLMLFLRKESMYHVYLELCVFLYMEQSHIFLYFLKTMFVFHCIIFLLVIVYCFYKLYLTCL